MEFHILKLLGTDKWGENSMLTDVGDITDQLQSDGFPLAFIEDAEGEIYIVDYLGSILKLVAAPQPDYNGDGVVNAADYVVWRNNQGSTGAPGIPGDGDDGSGTGVPDGVVDMADFDFWKSRFGQPSYASQPNDHAVPEPIGAVLAISAGALLLASRRCWN